MTKSAIAAGVAHDMPKDLEKALTANAKALEAWNQITPLARNEWICWVVTVKQQKTRDEHIQRAAEELADGKRRPCCWIGCVHRTDKQMSKSQQWVLGKQTKK